MSTTVVFLLALLACISARTLLSHPCNFAQNCVMHDFSLVKRADLNTIHTVTLHLKQKDMDCGSLLMSVSDPKSPKYGQFYTFEQIHDLVFNPQAVLHTKEFLQKAGLHGKFAPNGEFVKITAPLKRLEQVFHAQFHHFESQSRNARLLRTQRFTLPHEIAPFVVLSSGFIDFPMYTKHTKIHQLDEVKARAGSVTPQLLWSLYQMPNETDSTPLADQSVFESLGQSYSPDDLTLFQQTYNIPIQNISQVIGPNDPTACVSNPNNCGEANLDVQYLMAMAQASPTIYWSIDQNVGDIFLVFIQQVAATATPPQVFSISYGGPEHLQDPDMMYQFNQETCKLGLRGITLFASSGDDGVAGYEARGRPSKCGFVPQFPANCPYVTVVGATMGPENGKPEVACQSNTGSIITTGGGFSNFFPQPQWQSNAVAAYLQTPNLPPRGMFNVSGRAYPDVASLGNAYNVFIGGNQYQVSGTSASCPVFCGMVTLTNGDREVEGKKPLGFLNPLLYSLDASVYNDITQGQNNCAAGGGSGPTCCQYGFYCSPGWDPVTGFGSIDFDKFSQVLANLP